MVFKKFFNKLIIEYLKIFCNQNIMILDIYTTNMNVSTINEQKSLILTKNWL